MVRLLIVVVLAAGAALGQSFEVASVRAYEAAADQPIMKNPGANPIRISGSHVDLRMVSLKDLVMAAYNVKEYQVTGGPGWTTSPANLFDVAAKASGDEPVRMERARALLRDLLTQRFHLTLRRESKETAVYDLVVAKGGLKLKAPAADTAPSANARQGTMEEIAALMSLYLDRPVLDKTGLAGLYEYSSDVMLLDMGAADSADVIARTLTALQERLGLRVQASKENVEMLVIVSAEKPAEN